MNAEGAVAARPNGPRPENGNVGSRRPQTWPRLLFDPQSNRQYYHTRNRPVYKLQENNLAAVRILPKRYCELERNQPYVAFIGITPIAKG